MSRLKNQKTKKPREEITLWSGSLTSGNAVLNDSIANYDEIMICSYNTYYKWWANIFCTVKCLKEQSGHYLIQARNDDRHYIKYINDTTIAVSANFGSVRKIVGIKEARG